MGEGSVSEREPCLRAVEGFRADLAGESQRFEAPVVHDGRIGTSLVEACVARFDRLAANRTAGSLSRALVLTGNHAAKEVLELADLVTEMKEIKHPFGRGIKAKKGIDY